MGPCPLALYSSGGRRCGIGRGRASCTGCAKTHVLLPAAWLSRRGDAVSVVGSALLAKAAGTGHRVTDHSILAVMVPVRASI